MAKITQIQVAGTTYDLPGSDLPGILDAVLASRGITYDTDKQAWIYEGHNIFTPEDTKADKEAGYANALIFYSQAFIGINELENGYNSLRNKGYYVIPYPTNIPLNTEPLVAIDDMLESNQTVKYVYTGNLYVKSAYEAFGGCSNLVEIIGNIFVDTIKDPDLLDEMFSVCPKLQTFSLIGLSCNLNLSSCTNMTEETLSNLINNAIAQPDGFTITLPSGHKYDTAIDVAATAKKITLIS